MDIVPLAGVFKEAHSSMPFLLTLLCESGSVELGFILKATGLEIQIQEENKWSWNKITLIDL